MIEMNAPQTKALQRVCIRCGDSNVVSLNYCARCGFDLTSDLQRDYDLYRGNVPTDAPSGVGERASASEGRTRTATEPGAGNASWQPYRSQSAPSETPAKATMDPGAAVLAAVFDGPQDSGKPTLDIAALGPLLLEEGIEVPDPVAWSPSSAMRVETPVIVGQVEPEEVAQPVVTEAPQEAAQETSQETSATHIVGALEVEDWASMSPFDDLTPQTPPATPSSRPVFASTAQARRAPIDAPTPRPTVSEPISQRNHIKVGATTYVDAIQGGFQRPVAWWQHQAFVPVMVALSTVGLIVVALM